MTERLYYSNATLKSFRATVVACDVSSGRAQVVLDRTAFYPTSGGQPFDTGTLGPWRVLEVLDAADEQITHVVTGPLTIGDSVEAVIDWDRRFDHMQQHTGQHVLSAAFDRLFGLATLSFHMGAELSTIDLSREATATEVARAEQEANRVVWEDRLVRVRMVGADEAQSLPLRKAPSRSGELRIVEVEDFDWSACGGTHVARSGQIGLIAVTGTERFKGGTRVSFACGGRALDAFRSLREVVAGAVRSLSVPPADLVSQIERLQQAGRESGRQVKALQEQLDLHTAERLRHEAETIGSHRVVITTDPRSDPAALKALAQAVATGSTLIAVVIGAGQPTPVVIARGDGETIDAGGLVKALTDTLGGRGGGRPQTAQGGITADAGQIVSFLRRRLES
jgi:alanyl-tRNA synthetase